MFPGARCLLRVRIYTQNKKTFDLIKGKGMEGKRKEYGPVSRGQSLKKSPGAMKTKVRCQIWVPLCVSCHSHSLAAAGQAGNGASKWLLLIYLFFDKVSCSLH